MNPSSPTTIFERYLAVDLHKHYVMVGGVSVQQAIVLQPRRVELDVWLNWAKKNLRMTDTLVIEATTNAWDFYDQTKPHVGRMVVANAMKVKLIAETRVKTDKRDTLVLARLLAAGLIPEVWVPPMEVRELRGLIAHRRQMVKRRTMIKNHLHSLLHRHHLLPPEGDPFAAHNQTWWAKLRVTPTETLHLKHDLAALQLLDEQIGEAEVEVERLSTEKPWCESLPYLLQLPGFGVLAAMIMLGAIGDITRFETAKQLVGYAGLGASIHSSGQTHRTGRITKQGRKDMRWVLVEAAWVAVQKYPYWQTMHERLSRRKHPNQAVVAVARHLLIAVWHVLSEYAADKHADPKLVATKLMRWSWTLTEEQRGGLTSRQFIRYQLMRLKLGDDLTHLQYGNMPRRIATVEEMLTLKPELRAELERPEKS